MDNCSIHIDTRVGSLIADAGAVLLYSALYSPDLIPIEYMFHSWKAFLKRHSTEFFNNWYEIYLLAIMSVTPEQGLNFFKKTTLVELIENHPLLETFEETTACTFLILELLGEEELLYIL